MISVVIKPATRVSSGHGFNGEDGFPHSEICGSKIAHISPQLIAACHVLHRLYMPRHPPSALTSRLSTHNQRQNCRQSCKIFLSDPVALNSDRTGRRKSGLAPATGISTSINSFTMSKNHAGATQAHAKSGHSSWRNERSSGEPRAP